MSNNLLPQPCMQMGQFINVPTPTPELISNPEMRLSQPICSHISGGRQDFHVMLPSVVGLGSVNMDKTLLPGKRKSPLHPSVQNKRMALPMEGRPWASAPMPVQLSSVSPRTQYLPASFVSKNSFVSFSKPGKQAAARKPTLQKPMLLKPQSESSGSVRSKMRESLAGALAMVQCQMDVPNESKMLDSETVANPLEGHVSGPVSAASGVDVMVSNGSTEMLTLSDPSPVAGISVQTVLPEILSIAKTSDAQVPEAVKPFVQDNVSYSDNVFSKDDLLQGNDLSWALESDIEFTVNCQNEMIGAMANDGSLEKLLLDPQVLAFEIETELFKLFGGVNKKYKEKGRSLLFNLKDKSNPKLREKVMYGEIAAERLCSMSAEELASKELAEWRQAKAEEMAQMVVLQDTEVDIRSLVRKTHKGEFQVEVEPMDSGSVEVSVGMSSINWSRTKNFKKKTPSITKTLGVKNELNSSNESTGPINGVTIDDEMQAATGSLPPIVSLDEFMSSIDSESPSGFLSSDTEKKPSVSDNNDVEEVLVSSPKESANIDLCTSPVKAEALSPLTAKASSPVNAEDADIVSSKPSSDLKSKTTSVFIPDGERLWEGVLQLSPSTVSSVIGILRSGEKTTTKEWPILLEIKGRVRLDAFEKFVRELPNSRSRAVMVMCFVCKEECSKTEQENISEVVDSYAKDGRVGYAEPASGVELYLCPTRGRTVEILNKIVPRNQLDFLKSINDDGLIGVVVWRRHTI
ncbi:SPOC domain / Transcription elongation factor S-II protein [Arabidopsis thaliana]|uniref:SPOC domain / Transcription elongation factor S-II protein n=1 Tax=Arabidopsis thaliana TaxID=3702 RepID=F4ISL5_ARATH|nr:SPOC domain / Transcription elongation factor S-II protein [Arabidopsis thaliana]AEC07729.1 SPOC domain / Transcription elongation factor S-II protein [Arabidopsis thaliana]|eukprot:NP_180135.2 SPOC domain / Transcription elongation factor S-II protein [Arabidopsis thaliana]